MNGAFREWRPEDRAACLALFDENCPEFFAPNERSDYEAFLDGVGAAYRVGEIEGKVTAAYGLLPSGDPTVLRLNWIMVARRAHGAGVGRAIMAEVVTDAQALRAHRVEIAASHKSAPFFARFGALETGRTENGWGPGMHRVDMILSVAAA